MCELSLNGILNSAGILLSNDINPVVRYKLLKDIVRLPENSTKLAELKEEVLCHALVRELENEQKYDGSWGRFMSKDYTLKNKFPTTVIAIDRALYIGLDKSDIILSNALDHVKEVFTGRVRFPDTGEVNERWPAMQKYRIARCLEKLEPDSEYTDEVWHTWMYIISRVFKDGVYNQENDKIVQSEVFGISGNRLIPIPFEFMLLRRNDIPQKLEQSMLDHCWKKHCANGYFWPEAKLASLPPDFRHNKTHRWFYPFEFFTGFRYNGRYMGQAAEWIWNSRNEEGLWDFGPQVKDPWGYFRYLSEDGWRNSRNRVIDCTVEVLFLLRKFIDSN